MKAVVDIDNTLWPFCDAFYEKLKKINGAFPPPGQWTTVDFWERYCSKKDFMDAINAIHHEQDSDRYQPYPESRDFLLSLKEHGYYVIIASHRLEETRKPTERWLALHKLPYDELHLSFDKTVLFDQAAIVVDDAPQTLEKAVASCALGVGLLFPWNRSHARNGFELFQDLRGVLSFILRARSQMRLGSDHS
jgi:hypothetical protein